MSIFVLNIATMLGLAAGDRLLAVHRQPLPRGAAPRPDRRRGGRARGRHGRQGGRVQRHRGRDRAVRAAAVRGAGHPLDRHRRRARRALLGRLRADLPAGRARDARPSGQRAVARRAAPSLPAGRRRRRARPDRRAGSASRTRSCAGRSPSSSRPSPSCSSPAARSCASSRASRAPRSTRPASRAATPTSRSRPSSRRARRRRSSSSPTSRARRPTSPTSQALDAYAATVDGARGHRSGREPVRRSTTRQTGAPLTPDQVAALYALPDGPAPARARRPARPHTSAARPSGSTPSARSRRPSPTPPT